jgi:hypothetical protein
VKLYIYRARVLEQIGKIEQALADLKEAKRLEPGNRFVKSAWKRLRRHGQARRVPGQRA